MKRLATACVTTLLFASLPPVADATWSVCAADRRTGEIALAQATCIVGPDLQAKLAIILPGKGGGCVQQWWDNNGAKRIAMHDGLLAGLSPQEILDGIQLTQFQYGLVDTEGRSATFTGSGGGNFAGGVAGTAGDIAYAVQGNVLAGQNVVDSAVQALLATSGALPDRVMAAMRAAAEAGGDGRCSCNQALPASCGSPPPGFDLTTAKSAHTGFFLVARIGDAAGICERAPGCANGDYFLAFNTAPGQSGPPDPIVEMEAEFAAWKAARTGQPDQLESITTWSRPSLPGNGTARSQLLLQLVDYHGTPILHGGYGVRVRHAPGSDGLSSIGPVHDHGDGSYSVPVTAGVGQGLDRIRVEVDDGIRPIVLAPDRELLLTPTLSASSDFLSATAGGAVGLSIHGPERQPSAAYLLVASVSGTDPGTGIGSTWLPLNTDWMTSLSFALRNTQTFQQTLGTLGPDGAAQATFQVGAGTLAPLVGTDLSFAWLVTAPVDFASNPVTLRIDP